MISVLFPSIEKDERAFHGPSEGDVTLGLTLKMIALPLRMSTKG